MRGDLFRLRPGKESAGPEQRGPRYAVAIQSDGILLSRLIVAPTSTSAQAAIFRPEIELDGTRIRVLVDQMRAVDASRLGDFAGRLDAMETERSTGPSGSCSEFSETARGARLGQSARCRRNVASLAWSAGFRPPVPAESFHGMNVPMLLRNCQDT